VSTVVAPGLFKAAPAQVSDTSVSVVVNPQRQRLAGLDGVRGLAALYMLVLHIFLRAFPGYAVDHVGRADFLVLP
jgi:peptidoglycan/LPS O-acetylase OafA/YrhL